MPKKIISFTISEEVVEKMNQTSKALGISRSEYVEKMLNKGFHFSDDVNETMDKITELQAKVKNQMKAKECD